MTLESRIPESVRKELIQLGHKVEVAAPYSLKWVADKPSCATPRA